MTTEELLLRLSLSINCIIVFPLTYLLLIRKPESMDEVYGPDSDARRILASVYFAIGVVSALAFFVAQPLPFAAPLLTLQIIYKLTTVAAVGLKSPVVIANVCVVVFHLCTLMVNRPSILAQVVPDTENANETPEL